MFIPVLGIFVDPEIQGNMCFLPKNRKSKFAVQGKLAAYVCTVFSFSGFLFFRDKIPYGCKNVILNATKAHLTTI